MNDIDLIAVQVGKVFDVKRQREDKGLSLALKSRLGVGCSRLARLCVVDSDAVL